MEESCTWYKYYSCPNFTNDMYTTEHYQCDEPNLTLGQLAFFNYCPYCGKKIKIKNNGTLKNNNYHVKAEIIDH